MVDRVDVAELIERRAAPRFIALVIIMIAAAAFLEGFDGQIQGYTAPTITKLWHIKREAFSPVFTLFQFGFMIGAIGIGNLGDILGRRRLIVFGVFFFGIFTMAGALCSDVTSLAATRCLSGVFLGGATPNAIALMIDYSPHKRRALNVGIMYTLYTFGGSIGGFLSAWLVPQYGWQIIFELIGGVAVVYSVILAWRLPESIRFLAATHRRQPRLAAIASHLAPGQKFAPDTQFYLPTTSGEHKPWVGELFAQRRAITTIALWLAYGLNLMAIVFVTSWMPTVFRDAGITLSHAVVATSLYQFGGAVGSVFFGWILGRQRGILLLAGLCLLAVPLIIVIGQITGMVGPLLMIVFLAGLCIVGTQTGLNALSGALYPTSLRATGAGWASGIGRVGAICGPLLGGVLISLGLPLGQIFLVLAIPSALVGCCIGVLHLVRPQAAMGAVRASQMTASAE
jgi:AAHS family 4-hydroxybenzoate transporter-like MFS transporter